MADNKNRQALSDGSLDEVSGGYLKDLGNGVIGVFDDKSHKHIKSFTAKRHGKSDGSMVETWKKASAFDNMYNHHTEMLK